MCVFMSDVPAALTDIGRTGWTTAARTRSDNQTLYGYTYDSFGWYRNMTEILLPQTKDKMCDLIDTTYLYPFTTTAVSKTSRNKDTTAGTPSVSYPPTSAPTEGKSWNKATQCITSKLLFKQWWMETTVMKCFYWNNLYEYWCAPLSQGILALCINV